MRVALYIVIFLVAACLLALGAAALGLFDRNVVSSQVEKPLAPDELRQLAGRGAYVAVAADCYACHTARGGAPWAGGMPFKTPFGTIYSTNISPDKENGIGGWSRADFHQALRDGVGKGGRHLYPAMPYTSYRYMTPEDVDAVYAFLMTREPMKVKNRKNDLMFPFDIRAGLAFWNLIGLKGGGQLPDAADRSDLWQRGRYLAKALAHCGECHTPRDALQRMEEDKSLQGAVLEGIEAPDITRKGLKRMGFDPTSLSAFLKSGVSAQGAMAHQMFDVVHFSTQYMRDEDLKALSAYLFNYDEITEKSPAPSAPKTVAIDAETAASAKSTYLNLCAGCHGAEGQGIPHVSVPLDTNGILRIESPRNLVRTVLQGLPAQTFPGMNRMQPMPGFADELSDSQMADLVNWLRARWGGQEPSVEPEDIAGFRKQAAAAANP